MWDGNGNANGVNLLEVLWSNAREVEAECAMDEEWKKNRGERQGPPKRHSVWDRNDREKKKRTIDLCEVFRIRIVMFVESRESNIIRGWRTRWSFFSGYSWYGYYFILLTDVATSLLRLEARARSEFRLLWDCWLEGKLGSHLLLLTCQCFFNPDL